MYGWEYPCLRHVLFLRIFNPSLPEKNACCEVYLDKVGRSGLDCNWKRERKDAVSCNCTAGIYTYIFRRSGTSGMSLIVGIYLYLFYLIYLCDRCLMEI